MKHRKKGGRMGLIGASELPAGCGVSRTIVGAESIRWAVTGDFRDIAKNHCAAVAVTNLALYFSASGGGKLAQNGQTPEERRELFRAVHRSVGNGPVAFIARKARKIFRRRGYALRYTRANTLLDIRRAIDNDHPVAVQIAGDLFHWHWVLCVGYRWSLNGGFYLQVVDGWNNTTERYYKPFSGAAWIAATQYWIE